MIDSSQKWFEFELESLQHLLSNYSSVVDALGIKGLITILIAVYNKKN